jgi:hypothetical protein
MARILLVFALVLLGAGCTSQATPIPDAVPAPPQRATLGWDEPFPADPPRLVFRVHSFAVTNDGWTARVEVQNETDIPWELGDARHESERQFGVMLFATGDLAEVERRNGDGNLPAIRPATTYDPTLPPVLDPGDTWSGTISAHGSLAAGRYVRVTFGLLTAVGDPPDGVPDRVVWITDSSYLLRGLPPVSGSDSGLESAAPQHATQWRSSRRNAATTPRRATIPTATNTA